MTIPDEQELASRLADLIRFPSIAGTRDAFEGMQQCLAESYPLVHKLQLRRFGDSGLGLLFQWAGSDSALNAQPLVLMAHQDVVPVTGQDWTIDPFGGEIRNGRVHGRGALDDKGALTCVLAAVEGLLAESFQPQRPIYLLLGDCEETYGSTIEQVADWFAEQKIRPWLVLDEGGAVVPAGSLPGVTAPSAMIGVTEKGVLDLELRFTSNGGHASIPMPNGAVERLARAVLALERNPMSAELSEPVVWMFEALGAHAEGLPGGMYRNAAKLAKPLSALLNRMGAETQALLRPTMAVTTISGSSAVNVLPSEVVAGMNIRLSPGVSSRQAIDHIRRTINDPEVDIAVVSCSEASPISPRAGQQWEALSAAVAAGFPDAHPVPYLQYGATDARFLTSCCDYVYRFAPLRMSSADRDAIHAADESVAIDTLPEGVTFVTELIKRACA